MAYIHSPRQHTSFNPKWCRERESGLEGGVRARKEGSINDILDDNGVEQIRWYQSSTFVFDRQLLQLG